MKFSLLTYNLLYNRASKEVGTVLTRYKPDLVCLQELATDDTNLRLIQSFGYRLADFSNSFIRVFGGQIYGVATFYKPSAFSLNDSTSFNLPSSLSQMAAFLLHHNRESRTVLKNEFVCKKNGKKLTTYNIHLTPVATNTLRMKQIYNAFQDLTLDKNNPIIIAGDFNYPYGRKKLEGILKEYRLKEATSNVYYTSERKILKTISIKLKLDYIFYRNLKLLDNRTIDLHHSDHFPLLTRFEL